MLELLAVSIIFFIASGVSNFIGFGTGTVSIPLLLRILPYGQTLLLAGIMQWFSGLWKMLGFIKYINWRTTIIFVMPALIATVVGSMLVFIIPIDFLYRLLGICLIFYSQVLIFVPDFHLERSWSNTFIGGIAYGLSAGLFGIRGPVRATLLTSYDLPNREYIATSGVISLTADISRLFVYIYNGVNLDKSLWLGFVLFIPVTILAAYIAQHYVARVSQRKLEIVISIFLILIGLKLLIWGKS